jgi:hypothetical protein
VASIGRLNLDCLLGIKLGHSARLCEGLLLLEMASIGEIVVLPDLAHFRVIEHA